MAQLVVAAASAAVGFAVGGPTGAQIGWSIGMMIGAPTQRVQGNARLSDLKVTGAEYGQPIPYLLGHPRVAPQVWWASDRREIATTESVGKGGGTEVTTYTYEVDLLLGLCDNQIDGIARIWKNGKLVWTALDTASAASLAASGGDDQWSRLSVYTGSATQLPDPTYEAAVGAGNAPAYRGRGSVFIEGLQLGTSGQIPNLTFEVVVDGATYVATMAAGPEVSAGFYFNIGTPASGDSTTLRLHVGQWSNSYLRSDVVVYDVDVVAGTSVQSSTYNVISNTELTVKGSSDVDCMVVLGGTTARTYDSAGARVDFTLPDNLVVGDAARFARSGASIVFGHTTTGPKKLYRFSTAGGSPVATSAAMASYVNSIVILDGQVYAVVYGSSSVYRLDLATMTLQETIAGPAGAGYASLYNALVVIGGELAMVASEGSKGISVRRAGSWVEVGSVTGGIWSNQANRCQSVLVAGNLFIATAGTSLSPYKAQTFTAPLTIQPQNATIQAAVEAMCARAGMAGGTYDASALSSITRPVRGLWVSQVGPTRAVLDQLAAAYGFDAVLDTVLRFRPRAGASVTTLAWDDLGFGDDEPQAEPLALTVASDIEVPAQVDVVYANASADFNTDTQSSDRLTSATAETVQQVQLPLAMTPAEAKQVADAIMADYMASNVTTTLHLTRKHAKLQPADVVTATDAAGAAWRLRLVRRRETAARLEFEAVLDDATITASAGTTTTDYTESTTVSGVPTTLIEPMDIPILRDADDAPGWYVAAKGSGTPWPGGAVLASGDNTVFSKVADVLESAVFGTATTVLGAWSGGAVFDERNTVTVNVGAGTLDSVTRDALLADATVNAMLIGDEVVRFRAATFVSAGVYTLSGLLRGQRGTEWATDTHGSSERAVLLRLRGLRRITTTAAAIGIAQWVKGVTIGSRVTSGASEAFTDSGRALRPLAPVDLRAARTGGDAVLTWRRRTRLATRFGGASGVLVPLGEDTEAYEVDILDGATVKRTIACTASTATYTEAQQIADFGASQTSITAKVYQLSASVGRGTALSATVALPAVLGQYAFAYTGLGTTVVSLAPSLSGVADGVALVRRLGLADPVSALYVLSGATVNQPLTSSAGPASVSDALSATGLVLGVGGSNNVAGAAYSAVFLPEQAGLFERVTWTGDGTGNRDVAHALGVAPALVLAAPVSAGGGWWAYTSVLGGGNAMPLTDGGDQFAADTTHFPNTATSTHLRIGSDLNANGVSYQALAFATTGSLVTTGTYTGNGSTQSITGLGFKPEVLIIRGTDATDRRTVITSDEINGGSVPQYFLDHSAMPTTTRYLTLAADGFDLEAQGDVNANAVTYQYIAIKPKG